MKGNIKQSDTIIPQGTSPTDVPKDNSQDRRSFGSAPTKKSKGWGNTSKGVSKIVLNPLLNIYEVDGVQLTRVTKFLDKYKKPFDMMGVSIGVTSANNKKGITNTLSPQDRVHYWNLNSTRSTSYGTGMHVFAEMYDMLPDETIPEYPKEHAVVKFIKDTAPYYELIGNELRVFNKGYKLAGTIDRLLRNKVTGKYVIMDWKSSSNIDKSYNKMKAPFNEYPQCKRIEYEMQLLTYKYLGNIELPSKQIVHITPDQFDNCIIVILKNNGSYQVERVNVVEESLVYSELERMVTPEDALTELV